jgi:preprotein translocase subunit YajC
MIALLAQESSQNANPLGLLGLLIFLIPLGLLFVMMRSQKKRLAQQQAIQRSAEIGDDILTSSGMFGRIVDEDEDEGTILVEVAPGVRVTMVRGAIARTLTEPEDEDEDENAEGPIG